MPRRNDLKKILIIGSGPIVIGQACEFDYSGTQGAKALAEDGYEVVLVNSNPATIMTDPELAVRTYVEPLEPATLAAILSREAPDALLPTLGGQTALNLALNLAESGELARRNVELLGAVPKSIHKAEDRQLFKRSMKNIGLECPRAGYAQSVAEAIAIAEEGNEESEGPTGYPVIIRASFTLGGAGGGIARNRKELERKVAWALDQSPVRRVLIEESVLGWKEYELEVIRDGADNFCVVCTIENIDPMGVHTGDSVTVAPAMTLTDREYQRMRSAARAVMSEIGVRTGGSNVQFALRPSDGRLVVIEMNPRVSRSSALASKATGYPIAKVAARLAVGYHLDELKNDIATTSAAFEPAIDYVVVKWPRFSFEKFPGVERRLGPQMKSVGEVMAIGRTFVEALEKAARSLEIGRGGLESQLERIDYSSLQIEADPNRDLEFDAPAAPKTDAAGPPSADQRIGKQKLLAQVLEACKVPNAERVFFVADALRLGATIEQLHEATAIDPWFLEQIQRMTTLEKELTERGKSVLDDGEWLALAKRFGLSDRRIADLVGTQENDVAAARARHQLFPSYHQVDTCAAEFEAKTPYLYSTYEPSDEAPVSNRKKAMILGGGPNRIGQGIEFDYCCVHAAMALAEMDIETIMVNCNPETVSTDYDTSDRLYFEPLTDEDVIAIAKRESEKGELLGVIVQYGGQTPLKLARGLESAGIRLLGTPADAIDRAEDRGRSDAMVSKLGLARPDGATAESLDEAIAIAERIGYPVLVRPSYVLGGRAMMICHGREELTAYVRLAQEAAAEAGHQTLLIDQFLEDAIEIDVDALCDGKRVVIGGVMQHIEEAGIHSGDSACVFPPHTVGTDLVAEIEAQTKRLGLELGVIGLMNVQFAVKDGRIYVIEVNPRASRTVPFVSKASGRPLAKLGAKVMAGATLDSLGVEEIHWPAHVAVKESVFPFMKFPGVDTQLGPEMRSTGEVMGIAPTLAQAFHKASLAAGTKIPSKGRAFISVMDSDKPAACLVARRLRNLGFDLLATKGTAEALRRARVPAEVVNKVHEGSPHIVDAVRSGHVAMVINTTVGAQSVRDSYSLRRQSLVANVPYFTTMAAAHAAVVAIEMEGIRLGIGEEHAPPPVRSLQEWHARRP